MTKNRTIEEALDHYLDGLLLGESVEELLSYYPELAEELSPLLQLASQTIASNSAIPNPELKSETRRNLGILLGNDESQSALEDALDQCVDLLLQGYSIEQCLERYPTYATALGPVLKTALALKQEFAVEARAEFKDAALTRVLSHANRKGPGGFISRLLGRQWSFRGAVALASMLIVVLVGVGTVKASSDSMPDDLLYPVKEFTEKVELTMAMSAYKEADVHIKLANRRAQELAAMAREGDYEGVRKLAAELGDHLDKVSTLVQEQQRDAAIELVFERAETGSLETLEFDEVLDIRDVLDDQFRAHTEMFDEALQEVPMNMRAEMKAMLQDARERYVRAIEALQIKQGNEDEMFFKGVGLAFYP